ISINQLLDQAGQQAERVRQQSIAAQLCQSKLAEVVAGIVPLSSQNGEFEELPGWEWSVDAEQHDISSLWRVRVSVPRHGDEVAAAALAQCARDASKRGSAPDWASPSGADSTGSGSSPSSGTTTQPSTTTPSAPATGGTTTRPATGGSTAPTTGGATTRPSTT